MPAPTTNNDFLELVHKSGLIEPARLAEFKQQNLTDNSDNAPRRLAALLVSSGLLTQFQTEQLLLGKWRGFSIGKYKVLERLGSGGMGTVYLCEHMVMHRKVAIKVLPTSKADNPVAIGRFYREARAAGVLNHPNLVRAHDIDEDGGLHFLIMDFVDGISLQALIARFGPLSIPRATHYIRQVALGLQHAHEAGLIHRDIKPANLMLDRGGIVRILDLGLARFNDNADQLTLNYDSKGVLGTADYVAPEQALNSHEADIRSDIYSLGATFYFLLTGQTLFPEGRAAQKLIAHQTKQPTPVRNLRSEVSEELAAVLMKMLAKDPKQRFQTPGDVANALAPWTATPIPPPPDAEIPSLSPALSRLISGTDTDLGSMSSRRLTRSGSSSSGAISGGLRSSSSGSSLGTGPTPVPRSAQRQVSQVDLLPVPRHLLMAAEASAQARSLDKLAATTPSASSNVSSSPPKNRRMLRMAAVVLVGSVIGLGMRYALDYLKVLPGTTAVAPAANRTGR